MDAPLREYGTFLGPIRHTHVTIGGSSSTFGKRKALLYLAPLLALAVFVVVIATGGVDDSVDNTHVASSSQLSMGSSNNDIGFGVGEMRQLVATEKSEQQKLRLLDAKFRQPKMWQQLVEEVKKKQADLGAKKDSGKKEGFQCFSFKCYD